MAQAISCFKWNGTEADPPKRFRIFSLTIRVTPCRREAAPDGYTFVDFFDPQSPVIEAIRNLDCKKLRFEISRSVLDSSYDTTACDAGKDLEAIKLRLCHQHMLLNTSLYGANDSLAGDEFAQKRRAEQVEEGHRQLELLAHRVREVCKVADDGKSPDVDDENEFATAGNAFEEGDEDDEDDDDLGAQIAMLGGSDTLAPVRDHGPTATEVLASAEANAATGDATAENEIETQESSEQDAEVNVDTGLRQETADAEQLVDLDVDVVPEVASVKIESDDEVEMAAIEDADPTDDSDHEDGPVFRRQNEIAA
ncbi:hypothetical protein LIA77_01089 [Sarocladium implicatum]|nr:hypothetical protein LIA77_01089 [Sarocladium implicatum]